MKSLNFMADIATSFANHTAEKANEIRKIEKEIESYSDDELFQIINNDDFFGPSSMKKAVARKILIQRGYDNKTINERI